MQPQQAVISEAMPSAARSTKQEMYNAGTASLVHPSLAYQLGGHPKQFQGNLAKVLAQKILITTLQRKRSSSVQQKNATSLFKY